MSSKVSPPRIRDTTPGPYMEHGDISRSGRALTLPCFRERPGGDRPGFRRGSQPANPEKDFLLPLRGPHHGPACRPDRMGHKAGPGSGGTGSLNGTLLPTFRLIGAFSERRVWPGLRS